MAFTNRNALIVIGVIVCLRLTTLGLPALIDSTEGRYGSIAQIMLTSGDWIVPQVPMPEGIIPYWGKPPLHFWINALSLKLFGMNEFAARLPSLLGALLTALFVWIFANRFYAREIASKSVIVFLSSGLIFFLSGGVHLDCTLLAAITGALVCFAMAVDSQKTSWGYGFFVSLAAGFMTKGPIAIVLCVAILLLWLILAPTERHCLKRIPWISGALLFLILTVPWFILAERESPGLVKYFFVNENFLRYVQANYGDKYGSGHRKPYGASWVLLAIGFMPWTLALALAWWKLRGRIRECVNPRAPWNAFVFSWALIPPLFFTLARQILPAYLLPAFPGLAILTAVFISQNNGLSVSLNQLYWFVAALFVVVSVALVPVGAWYNAPMGNLAISLAIAILVILGYRKAKKAGLHGDSVLAVSALILVSAFASLLVVAQFKASRDKSTKYIFEYIEQHPHLTPERVAVLYGHPFSAYFYGAAADPDPVLVAPHSPDQVLNSEADHILLKIGDVPRLSAETSAAFEKETQVGKWVLMRRKAN
ncbi:MAG: glycosyltransferase family 39 protein [Oligoflexia bacterium]|nr:glycosyltransferase family 39 protein [Oligoflexia bacterium]